MAVARLQLFFLLNFCYWRNGGATRCASYTAVNFITSMHMFFLLKFSVACQKISIIRRELVFVLILMFRLHLEKCKCYTSPLYLLPWGNPFGDNRENTKCLATRLVIRFVLCTEPSEIQQFRRHIYIYIYPFSKN